MREVERGGSPDGGRPDDRLVGRAAEVRAFERILDGLDEGIPGALVLVGEPGIGKTRLLTELCARSEMRGHLVLYGAASELERDAPFAVLVDAFDDYLAGLDPRRFESLDPDARAEVAGVFPSLSGLGGGRRVALQQERHRTHRALRALLEHLAGPRPLVVALDDVHWADPASVELIGLLLRRPPGAPVLIALAVRPHQAPRLLAGALERTQPGSTLTRIELNALTLDDAQAFVGRARSDADVAALHAESGGIPLYLEQLSRSLDASGDASIRSNGASRGALDGVGLPTAVAASLGEELGLLSERARAVLAGAAVAGDPFEPELAAAAAERSERDALAAVDELLGLDLIRTTEMPRRFRFRHPIVRRAVYETSGAGWRLEAHRRCAAALAALGAPPGAQAQHVERYAAGGDLAAVAILREAGEAALRLAPASAAHWFAAALRLLPEGGPVGQRLELLLARSGSLAAIGRLTEARGDLLAALDLSVREAPSWRVRITTACTGVEHLLGLQREAHRHLASALADLGGAASADAVTLMIELSVDGMHAGDFESMRAWANRAVATVVPLQQPALLAAAISARAWSSATGGLGAPAKQECDEATAHVDGLADEVLAHRLDALANLASAELFLDRFPAAARHARRALEVGRATGRGDVIPVVVAMLGGSLWMQGEPREAVQLFDEAVEAARLAGNVQSVAWMLFNQSIAALAAGDLDVALSTAEESVALMDDPQPGLLSATAAAVLATVLVEHGQPERGVEMLLTRAGGEEISLIGGGWRVRFLEVLVRASLACGRRADAERAAATARAAAQRLELRSADGLADLAAAAVALDAGDAATAAGLAASAAEAFESVAARWDAARAQHLAGRALRGAGQSDRAVEALEIAATMFDAFGSVRFRSQVERELRELGRYRHHRSRPSQPGATGLGALTERERQVARLVTDRMTNGQIAAELFLTEKTVETHLRNIFNKVGVANRVALSRVVERADREVVGDTGFEPVTPRM